MAYTHVGTKYTKRQQDFENFLIFRHTLLSMLDLANVNEITFLVVNLNLFPLHEYPSKRLMESAFQPVLPINF